MFHRRFFPRQTISLPAWIEVNSSRLLERCKLMDLSESAANEVGVEFVTPKRADNAAFADEPSLLS